MGELIKVKVKGDQQLVSARDLHKGLRLTTRFSKWVDQNFHDFESGIDFMSVTGVTDMPNGGTKPIQDYAVTIDMAKQLCMMSHTELGKKYRRYFIELERKWNDPQEVVKRGYAILQNENARLKIENAEMKPKANVANPEPTKQPEVTPAKPIEEPNTWQDALGDTWYEEKGTFVSTTQLHLRWGARTTSATVALLPAGSVIKYDAWSRHGGYVWLRQPRGGSEYAYIACRNAQTNEPYGTFK